MYSVKIVVQKFKGFTRRYLYINDSLQDVDKLAEHLGLHVTTLKNAIANDKKQHIIDWFIKKEHGMRPLCKVFWFGCECQSIDDLIDQVDLHPASASIRMRQWVKDGDTDNLYRPKQFNSNTFKKAAVPYIRPKPVKKLKPKPKPFNRTTFCMRDKGQEKCKQYDKCCNYRMKYDKHPGRFKQDGSCYDGIRIKFNM